MWELVKRETLVSERGDSEREGRSSPCQWWAERRRKGNEKTRAAVAYWRYRPSAAPWQYRSAYYWSEERPDMKKEGGEDRGWNGPKPPADDRS